jgi:hypothetical protein
MALIDCPEGKGQVSDRAPTCPHCGVPIAAVSAPPAANSAAAATLEAASSPFAETRSGSSTSITDGFTPQTQEVEPFKLRIAGRPIPIAAVLFWGGMVVGMIMSYAFPAKEGADNELWRYIPWLMIWGGVLWFAINELTALIRSRNRRRA